MVQSAEALGRALQDARKAKGLTQMELAELSGVSQPSISQLERGVTRGRVETLIRLLAPLGMELVLQPRHAPSFQQMWDPEE